MPLPQKDTECVGRDYQERPSGRPAVGPRHPWLQICIQFCHRDQVYFGQLVLSNGLFILAIKELTIDSIQSKLYL